MDLALGTSRYLLNGEGTKDPSMPPYRDGAAPAQRWLNRAAQPTWAIPAGLCPLAWC